MSSSRRTAPYLKPAFAAALPPWIVARILVALGMVTGAVLYDGAETDPLRQGLWAWDGAFYRDIADHGYQAVALEGLRFFPLYPLLGRVGNLFGSTDVALLVVTNASASGQVDGLEERRGEGERQDRRADVVAEAGERQLLGPGAAAHPRCRLVDADRPTGTGQGAERRVV